MDTRLKRELGAGPGGPKTRKNVEMRPKIVEPSTPMARATKPEPGYRVLVNVEVFVQSQLSHRAVVLEASVDGSVVIVSMLDGKLAGSDVRVKGIDVLPRQPGQDHAGEHGLVKIVDGPFREALGWLHAIGNNTDKSPQARVKLCSGQVYMFDAEMVAIAHAPRTIRSVSPRRYPWLLT